MPKESLRADGLWFPKELVEQLTVEIVDGAHHFVREEHVVLVPARL